MVRVGGRGVIWSGRSSVHANSDPPTKVAGERSGGEAEGGARTRRQAWRTTTDAAVAAAASRPGREAVEEKRGVRRWLGGGA